MNKEEIDTPFPGGFTLNLDDSESEGETESEVGGRGGGKENDVKRKPRQKRELMKVMSGYDLTGWLYMRWVDLRVTVVIHSWCALEFLYTTHVTHCIYTTTLSC